jgi:hypothetical protein
LQAHCQSHTSQRSNQSFGKELAKPTQDKIVLKKFPTRQKKLKNVTNNRPDNDTKNSILTMVCKDWQTEHQPVTLCRIEKSPNAKKP